MSKSLEQAFEGARKLPDAEQELIAEEVEKLVVAARRRTAKEMLERIERESPFRGLGDELIRASREFRDGFRFKHDDPDEP